MLENQKEILTNSQLQSSLKYTKSICYIIGIKISQTNLLN